MSSPQTGKDGPDAVQPGLGEGTQFGKYRLHRRIARGGMGEVYLARLVGELGFEKQLVIKTILPELAEKAHFIELFAAEAKTAVALSHGNIVPAYELGRAADTFYIAMGYVDGPSVAQLLDRAQDRGEEPNISAAMHIIRGVLAGLAYAHREEPGRPAVVHRDITPRNVLIDRSGQVRIVDFGISAPARRQVGVRAGSTGFVAPEQARGEAAHPRADVFSVGCLLYELCTHQRAFPKADVWSTPDFEAVPESLRGPLRDAMQLDPLSRTQDASQLAEALRDVFNEHRDFADAALADHVRALFPDGWANRAETAPQVEAGLQAPSETFATRLTAVTGVESIVSSEDIAPDENATEAPSPSPAQTAEPSESEPNKRRIPPLVLLLGAVGIGAGAFAMGRTDARTQRTRERVASAQSVPDEARRDLPPALASIDPPTNARPAPMPTPPREKADIIAPLTHTFEVRPTKAKLTLDGTKLDDGPPYTIELPADGSVELKVRARGFLPQVLTLSREDTELPSTIELQAEPASEPKEPGLLRVYAPTVAWAEVRVDGKKVGNTPTREISLSDGRHRVEVQCIPDACSPQRMLYRKTITIESGRTTRIDAGRE